MDKANKYIFAGHPITPFGRQQSVNQQDFYQLRQKSLESKDLFKDPQFECTGSYEWLRPKEICPNPQFIVDGTSRFDVRQGSLGNCWLVAALANLTGNEKFFKMVVCEDNSSFTDNYVGIFHFRFWQHGRWLDVVIDDLLPTKNKKLVYMHSNDATEFWSALLEKAYAKVYGGYEALEGGQTCEALVDFTGGVAEMFDLKEAPENLFEIMQKGFEKQSMMGCSINSVSDVNEEKLPSGLIQGHAYSITRAVLLDVATPNVTGQIQMLRIRNPWGNEAEWNGAWSDKAPEWTCVSDQTKKNLDITFENDGEFWMSFRDFLKHFDDLNVCSLSPDSLTSQIEIEKKWNMNVFEGQWISGVSAGGGIGYPETFHRNPQFVLTIEKPETDEAKMCAVVVALMQKHRRLKRSLNSEELYLGFSIYGVQSSDLADKPKKQDFFKRTRGKTVDYLGGTREVIGRFEFPPGHYLIVPATYEPDKNAEFLIRVFTESHQTLEENDHAVSIGNSNVVVPLPQNSSSLTIIAKLFEEHGDSNGEIGWKQLQRILTDLFVEEKSAKIFSESLCRSMVAMLDADFSGKLNLVEFQALFSEITLWKNAFKLSDKDNSNGLDVGELREAFASVGYQLNNRILNSMAYRYGSDDKTISLEDFILCAVKIKTMLQHFKEKDFENSNKATFTADAWIANSIYS